MDQQAAAQAQHHAKSRPAPVRGGLQEDEQVVRTGGEAQQQGNAEEGDAGVQRGHGGYVVGVATVNMRLIGQNHLGRHEKHGSSRKLNPIALYFT